MRSIRSLASLTLLGMLLACGGDESDSKPVGPPPPAYLPADGVKVRRVAIYQGLERELMKDGIAVTDGLSIVAGRDALVRVFYDTDASYDDGPVLATLTIGDEPTGDGAGGGGAENTQPSAQTFEIAGALGEGSAQDNLATTVNFDVPGKYLTPTSSFRVQILRAAAQTSGQNAKATYPATGSQALGAVSVGSKVRIVIVPIRYDADGSGRLPDTSPEQLAIYRDLMWKLYPTPEVEIRVADPLPSTIQVTGAGTGWGELLNQMANHRQKSGAAFDEYYYGLFQAADSFASFCGSGCIAGLSMLAQNAFNDMARVGIGIGFSGPDIAMTAAHEIGHEHGRGHTPCGTNQALDAGYPHSDAAIGLPGYDLLQKQLKPSSMKDYMSYCDPKWTSDFTFEAMLERIKTVNNASMNVLGAKTQRYERVAIDMDGTARWLEPIDLRMPPVGEPEPLRLEGPDGATEVVGQFFPYSHLPGGTVFFPAAASTKRAQVRRFTVAR
ncbi:MAG: hypothetical protein FJ096_18290 [Deltaproteobacteria bacterium]|nr:hypothetical protein [Deltaproteobacteria bacterium]